MIEVLKQMLEALEWCHGGEPIGSAEAIKAGKQAIADLESQEPVAWVDPTTLHHLKIGLEGVHLVYETEMVNSLPLYDKPQRTWVGLMDEEIDELHGSPMSLEHSGELKWVRIIEAKLKEKNT